MATGEERRVGEIHHLLNMDRDADDIKVQIFDLVDGEIRWYKGKPGAFWSNLILDGKDGLMESENPRTGIRKIVLLPFDIKKSSTGYVWNDNGRHWGAQHKRIKEFRGASTLAAVVYGHKVRGHVFGKYTSAAEYEKRKHALSLVLSGRIDANLLVVVSSYAFPGFVPERFGHRYGMVPRPKRYVPATTPVDLFK